MCPIVKVLLQEYFSFLLEAVFTRSSTARVTSQKSLLLHRSESEEREREASKFFEQQSMEEDSSPVAEGGVHPGEGGIFNFPGAQEGQGPVRLTNLTPIR